MGEYLLVNEYCTCRKVWCLDLSIERVTDVEESEVLITTKGEGYAFPPLSSNRCVKLITRITYVKIHKKSISLAWYRL